MVSAKRQTELKDVYALTIREAADVFNIGEKTIRRFIDQHPNDPCLFTIGKRVMIKREMFAKMLSETSAL